MKKIVYLFYIVVASVIIVGCEDYDPAVTPPASLSFVSDAVTVEFSPEEPIYPLVVTATNIADQDRVVNISILEGEDIDGVEYTTALPGDYTIESTSITIPAGRNSGSTLLTFDSEMTLGVSRRVSFEIANSDGYVLNNTSNIIKVNFTPACIYNAVAVDITTDPWGSETTWEILDSNSVTVASGGPYSDLDSNTTEAQATANFCFEDGDYTFIIYDSYGDGMTYTADGVTSTGSFEVSISPGGPTLVSGAGDSFASSASFDFTLPAE